MRLLKRIPAAAGLGGASSDAAAALAAAERAWRLPRTGALVEIGSELGSDIPFFFARGAALCRGRGEQVSRLGRIPAYHFVLVRPPGGLSTAEVYRHCRPPAAPRGSDEAVAALKSGNPARLGRALHNRLQEPAERLSAGVRQLRADFARLDCLGHQLSGSGSSYFGVCRNARHARRLAGHLRARGWGAVFHVTTRWTPELH